MGSGGSKLDPEREALPARLRPFLRRKLEEIRMNKSGRIQKDSHTLSKKMLLSRNTKDDDNSSHMDEDEHKSNSSLEDSTKVAPAPDSNGAKSSTTMVPKSMDTTFPDCQNVETKTGVSGGSKLDLEREALPARLRPFLRRKLEEIRMHKSGRIQKDSHTLSKKMLLSRNTKDDDNSSHMDEDEHKSNSSLEDSTKVAPAPDSNGAKSSTTMVPKSMDTTFPDCQNVETKTGSNKLCQAVNTETEMPEPESPQVPLAIAFYDERTIHYRKDDGKGEAKEVKLNVSDEHKEAEDGEEDEEKGRLVDCKDESCLCPGSPSFRVYFQESLGDANDDDEGDDRDEEIPTEEENGEMIESVKSSDEECLSPTDEKSPREQDNIEIVKSETSIEDSEQNKKNKGKRNRFRKAISNRSPGAVKHLLNVKACYYPSCAGQHHKTHLEKGVA